MLCGRTLSKRLKSLKLEQLNLASPASRINIRIIIISSLVNLLILSPVRPPPPARSRGVKGKFPYGKCGPLNHWYCTHSVLSPIKKILIFFLFLLSYKPIIHLALNSCYTLYSTIRTLLNRRNFVTCNNCKYYEIRL